MKEVKIVGVASEICWWRECVGQQSPVLDTYEPTGFIKIRVTVTERGFEDQPYQKEGWISPEYIEEVKGNDTTE